MFRAQTPAVAGKAEQNDKNASVVMANMQQNQMLQYSSRILAAVAAGIVAGLLGCEGLSGLLVFAVVTLGSSILTIVKIGFQVEKYFLNWYMHNVFKQ